ncbi:protein mono-ADP-ribosyltransferase PARP12 isoform X1 [Alosa alosa]|uniref:protein mono-ADP-ribosyltransferase PARP12 isoform X1 n=1 Tax=Alosa alosa TaxID=278164 RepID=UPI002015316B|nr:protein mono-ADP-ribosyltransferase PARP12 isoform X1 [Alosa alosa]
MSEATIIRKLCRNNGSMRYDDLVADLNVGNWCSFDTSCLENCELFSVIQSNGEKRVIAKTQVRLCKAKNCLGCTNLHLCKKFLLGECPFGRGRKPCRFGHDIMSVHNAHVLEMNKLEQLDRKELCTLLIQNDNSILPPVCFSYNNGTGQYGKCEDAEGCRRLHICERYLRGECSCPRAHDFFEPHPFRTLQDRGVPLELMASIKDIYANIEAMRVHTRGRPPQHHAGPGARPNVSNHTEDYHATASRAPEATRDKTEICMYFVKGSCKHGDRCWRAHSTLPYRWEVRDGQSWTALADNESVERDYCNPDNIYSKGVEPVCFDTMTCGLRRVRRISTLSSVLQPSFILTTEWAWYWEDEFGNWIQYATAEGGHSSASITSEDFEQKYQEDPSAVVEFTAGSQKYKLCFQDMIQTNTHYATKKLVRRRPVFVSAADAQTIKTSKKAPNNRSNFKALPAHWDKAQTPETGYKRVSMPSSTNEYKQIMALFNTTMRGFNMVSIERIQNKALWEVFQWQKDFMKKNNRGLNVMEKQLFHGTDSKHVDTICHNNFDWRICGTHGTAYGKGSYFARDAKYSHSYTNPSSTRILFVCRVLVGDFTQGHTSYLRPPSKGSGDTVFYDSCVDSLFDPSIYVIFERHQVYPEYLIKYEERAESVPQRTSIISFQSSSVTSALGVRPTPVSSLQPQQQTTPLGRVRVPMPVPPRSQSLTSAARTVPPSDRIQGSVLKSRSTLASSLQPQQQTTPSGRGPTPAPPPSRSLTSASRIEDSLKKMQHALKMLQDHMNDRA